MMAAAIARSSVVAILITEETFTAFRCLAPAIYEVAASAGVYSFFFCFHHHSVFARLDRRGALHGEGTG